MHQRLSLLAKASGAALLLATLGGASFAEEAGGNPLRNNAVEPAAWQGPAFTAQIVPPPPREPVPPKAPLPVPPPSPTTQESTEIVTPSSTPKQYEAPLLDGKLPSEELMPPVVKEGSGEDARRGVQPYGGGHPTDWSWGCGGSPYRTGPGFCDNWRVGPRWHITVDGLVMHRESTNLDALIDQMIVNDPVTAIGTPQTEQFGYGPGGRFTFTSQVGRCTNYDIQAAYEGINDWDASIVFPKQALTVVPNGAGNAPPTQFVIQPDPNTEPPAPFPEGFEQRSLHYRSNMNSVELNFLPYHGSEWRPTFGVRFIRFDDEISDTVNQEAQQPLAGPLTNVLILPPVGDETIVVVNDPIGPTSETDRLNLFHFQNNLMGFQIGLLHDTLQLNERFAIEGFVNGGVYYNKVKYSNVMIVTTTQTFADNTRSTGVDDSRVDVSSITNNDSRDISEIAYEAEASLTGVCRLNRCWALRGGYQVLWINNLHTADSAYLGNPEATSGLLFHGWHFGVECRR